MLTPAERDGREEVWTGKVHLPFRCSVRKESDGSELALVWYVNCVAPLDEGDEAMKCVCSP